MALVRPDVTRGGQAMLGMGQDVTRVGQHVPGVEYYVTQGGQAVLGVGQVKPFINESPSEE